MWILQLLFGFVLLILYHIFEHFLIYLLLSGPCVGVPNIGDVCVGGCIGFFGNADDANSKALNG